MPDLPGFGHSDRPATPLNSIEVAALWTRLMTALARRVPVPSGFALFAADLLDPPQAWLDRTANTVHVSRPARGGHFAAVEQPEVYADDLRTFFTSL